jgi:hypothetical protein
MLKLQKKIIAKEICIDKKTLKNSEYAQKNTRTKKTYL